jgi:hypothetical protein
MEPASKTKRDKRARRWRRGRHAPLPEAQDGSGPAEGGPGVELVVITGHSGAGKSEAIAAFEDGGYFCVDNLPPRMIGSLGELFRHEGSGVERAAVVSDVRGGEYFEDLLAVLDEFEAGASRPGCCSWRQTRRRCCTATRRPDAATLWPEAGESRTGSAPSESCSSPCGSEPTWSSTPRG